MDLRLFLIIFLFILTVVMMAETNKLAKRTVNVTVSNWHNEHNDLKIVVFSDIHAGSPYINQDKLKKIVSLVNEQKPDIVLIVGDYVEHVIGGKFIEPEITAKILSDIHSKYGVYGVLGNHDWRYNGNRVREALEANNIKILENSSVKIIANGKPLWIAGVGDLDRSVVSFDDALKDTDENPIILMSHQPDVFPNVPDKVTITLSGHVHGGQIRFPKYGAVILPSRYGKKYSKGLVTELNKKMFVTSGIGTSILPARLLNPPEIVVLQVTKEQ